VIVGTGLDVIEIARIERVLAERGERFERRVFTPQEIETCRGAGRPVPHFAVRFAIKEAAMKAVGTGWARGVRWRDIETLQEPVGSDPSPWHRLQLVLHGRAREIAATLAGHARYRLHVAASRNRTCAVAVVMLEVFRP
jgi:holo-[acyl-carrier protein] synthase